VDAFYATPLIALSPILILAMGIKWLRKSPWFSYWLSSRSWSTPPQESDPRTRSRPIIWRYDPGDISYGVASCGVALHYCGIEARDRQGHRCYFVGELFGAREGVGFLISISAQVFDIPELFVGVLILAIAGVLSVKVLTLAEVKIAPWRQFELRA
jgi:NitT/TauT family transport system permease protein